MKILLDTNILLDMAMNRNSNHDAANEVITSCVSKKHEGYITAHSICDFFYICRKEFNLEMKCNWVSFFINTFTILTEDKQAFINCLNAEDLDDLEDQLQMECSAAAELDYIITRNLKDFENSKVPAVSSEEFLKL